MANIILDSAGVPRFEDFTGDSSKIKKEFQASFEAGLFYLGTHKKKDFNPSLEFWSDFTELFIEAARLDPSVEELREHSRVVFDKSGVRGLLESAPFLPGFEYLNESTLEVQWQNLNQYFSHQVKNFRGSVEEYFSALNPQAYLVGRVYFHLVENKDDQEFPFAFMATYLADVKEKTDPTHRPLRFSLEEYANDQKKMLLLLAAIKRAARESKLIQGLLDSREIFDPLKWTPKNAHQFLEETPIYQKAGILCRIPNWWKKRSSGASLSFVLGKKKSSLCGLKSLIDFDLEISIGDQKLTEKEVKILLKESEGLAFLKGKWVKVDKDNLESTLERWKRAKELVKKHGITFHEAMRLLGGMADGALGEEFKEFEVSTGEWLEELFEKLKNPEHIRSYLPSRSFKGSLRKYQKRGLNWLQFLDGLGLGGCLADDMGLGKTVQVLAFLQKLSQKYKSKFLLIAPTSLLSNWSSEVKKFTPNLKTLVAHPSNPDFAKLEKVNAHVLNPFNLIITSYGLVRRLDWPKNENWDYVVLDEAQAIKNPNSAQTKAIKQLKAKNRLILTGTPIENQLGDLWSLFDFINPGLLGTKKEFSNLTRNISQRTNGYKGLRKVVSPYILRRLKTDKSIIDDLPPKIESKAYATLTKKQAVLYQKLVRHLEMSLDDSSGIERKGLILSSLLKFKQICNHPDQYLGTGTFKESFSGKFDILEEISSVIFEKREKVLIFTQFKEMIRPLDKFLNKISERKGVVLHGSTSLKKRKEAVKKISGRSKYSLFYSFSQGRRSGSESYSGKSCYPF